MKKTMRSLALFLSLLARLSIRDLKTRYISSYLGIIWAFVQPVVTVAIFWFVFSVGFKATPVKDYPFILWLLPGYLSWQYMAEAISGATHSIVESSYLVKKIVFRVELLPVVKIISAMAVHVFFIIAMVIIYAVKGYEPQLNYLQMVYYMGCGTCLVWGLSMLSSALTVFMRDIGQVVNMLVQIGFWGTPIFWDMGMIPERYRAWLELNPLYYVTEGYRQSMIYGVWFWDQPEETLRYWLITLVIMITGWRVFRRLRPHFADVL